MSNIKEFLKRNDIQELLQEENIDKVYYQYLLENSDIHAATELTDFFGEVEIDVLKYVTTTFPYMFAETAVEHVEIPDNVRDIDDCMFLRCSFLKSVVIPDSVKYIGRKAFAYCTALENITIPEDIKEIQTDTFRGCKSLKSVTIIGQHTKLPEDNFFLSGGALIRCYEHSAAHVFAMDAEVPFELI
jgi:hypothetical protein